MTVRDQIFDAMRQVAEEQSVDLVPLSDDVALMETGLDSLCFAILVARLETELGIDPFTASEDVSFPTTVGDFVALYQGAAPLHAAA